MSVSFDITKIHEYTAFKLSYSRSNLYLAPMNSLPKELWKAFYEAFHASTSCYVSTEYFGLFTDKGKTTFIVGNSPMIGEDRGLARPSVLTVKGSNASLTLDNKDLLEAISALDKTMT